MGKKSTKVTLTCECCSTEYQVKKSRADKSRCYLMDKLKSEIKFDKDANIFIAYSPKYRIFSQGKTIERAKLALEDAVESFLIVSNKYNLLEKCLAT